MHLFILVCYVSIMLFMFHHFMYFVYFCFFNWPSPHYPKCTASLSELDLYVNFIIISLTISLTLLCSQWTRQWNTYNGWEGGVRWRAWQVLRTPTSAMTLALRPYTGIQSIVSTIVLQVSMDVSDRKYKFRYTFHKGFECYTLNITIPGGLW